MDLIVGVVWIGATVVAAWALRKFHAEQVRHRSAAEQQSAKIAKYLDEMTRQSARATQLVEAIDLSCARLDKLDVALRAHIGQMEMTVNDGVEELLGVALQLQDAVEQNTEQDTNDAVSDVCPNSADGQHRLDTKTYECLACGSVRANYEGDPLKQVG